MEFLQYDFMKYALLAILIITPLFGILGTLIVNNRMAFFSDALGHSAFTGMAIGVLFGVQDTSISMLFFAVVFALLLNFIRHKNIVSSDTVISVFSSLSVAIGLAILSRNGDFSKYILWKLAFCFLIPHWHIHSCNFRGERCAILFVKVFGCSFHILKSQIEKWKITVGNQNIRKV